MTGIGDDHAAELARDGEDVALLARAHSGQDRAGEAVVAEDIGVEGQLRRFHVLHLDRAGDADPGIVDQHVEPATGDPLGFGNRLRHLVVEQHIELQHVDVELLVAGQLAQFLGLGARCVAHGGEDGRAEAGEMFAGQSAEAR